MDEELERFKRDIKLHEYAASIGYELDKSDSTRKELVLRQGDDKISIRKDMDGHYVYYSFRDPGDHGTVLDFVMRRQGKNFGEARRVLRIYAGTVRPSSLPVYEHLEPSPRFDRQAVQKAWEVAKDLRWHDYLEQDRSLPRRLLLAPRFKVSGSMRAAMPCSPISTRKGSAASKSVIEVSRVLPISAKRASGCPPARLETSRSLSAKARLTASPTPACFIPCPLCLYCGGPQREATCFDRRCGRRAAAWR